MTQCAENQFNTKLAGLLGRKICIPKSLTAGCWLKK